MKCLFQTSFFNQIVIAIFLLPLLVLGALPKIAMGQPQKQPAMRFEYTRPMMGTELKVILYAKDESHAAFAINALLEVLDERSKPINNYDPKSEVSSLATAEPGKPRELSRELGDLLLEAKRWHELSQGAFDVTAGSAMDLWSTAREQKQLPSAAEMKIAKQASGWSHFELVKKPTSNTEITLLSSGIKLNVSGIATGYLIDLAMDVLKEHGIESALIDIGGDIITSNSPPDTPGWSIDIAGLDQKDPIQRRLVLNNQAITTSGDLNQFSVIDGIRYSHIVDPTTGKPISRRVSATVVAAKGVDADAGATALAVLGTQRTKQIIGQLPVDYVLINESNLQDESATDAESVRFEWTKTDSSK